MFLIIGLDSFVCLQEDANRKDQNLRRNVQEIETLTFLNTQLKSRLEILQHELNDFETHTKLKKTNSNKVVQSNNFNDNVLAQELEQKIQQYEAIHRRVREDNKASIALDHPRVFNVLNSIGFDYAHIHDCMIRCK